MSKLKILEIVGDATLAGAPRHLLGLLENLDQKKFELLVICPPGPLAGEIRGLRRGVNLAVVPMASKLDFGAIVEVRKHIRDLKPDLIHIHGTRAGAVGRLAAINLKIPVIYTEHLWTKQYRLPSRLMHRIQIFGLWFLDMFTDFNIAVSQAVKDFMVENQISRPSKIIVIYNGIEPPKKSSKIFTKKTITLGTVGTLTFRKGIQYLIQALPKILVKYPKTHLVIVGEGLYKKHLQSLVRRLKLHKYVTFTGFIKDIEEKMKDFDLYVQPSLSESFGLAVVQAMSLGIPIVATNAGGLPEVVTTGKTGILVEAGKSAVLSEAILELLDNKEKARKMGKLAAEEAKIKFDIKEMVKSTERTYEKIFKTGT